MKILSSILLVSASANLAAALSPGGKTRRYVLFAVSLVTLLALFAPILGALRDGDVIIPVPESDPSSVESADPAARVTGAAEAALGREIETQFGVVPHSVSLALSEGYERVESVTVILPEGSDGLRGKIALWLSGECSAPVSVQVSGGDPAS